jgi:hypothetical protein
MNKLKITIYIGIYNNLKECKREKKCNNLKSVKNVK